jgi:hypothetical protein
MKIALNYIHPEKKKRCTYIELNSHIDSKNVHIEKILESQSENVTIINKNRYEHGDIYSHSIDEDYSICQKENNKPSSIKIHTRTEKKERKNSKKVDLDINIEKIDLFGNDFDTKIRAMKKRKGNTILGLEDIE